MAFAAQLEREETILVTSNMKAATKLHSVTEHRPCFAARMFTLIFKRRPSADKSRPKSWSGQQKSTPVETFVRHTSVNSMVSRVLGSLTSELNTSRNADGNDNNRDSRWRQRQSHCVNCERLFFISLSMLSCSSTRFCSLDCKTTFKYVKHLDELLALRCCVRAAVIAHSDEDDCKVEELDDNKLLTEENK
ncbi:unnamed protein product [Peronospora destructor]|uniref:Uncharacterized protein n=1 Tax=Peronospora destructor TaxID=86335 RepID=A0AAV0V4X6_9STRA|nr:unnamed protein product [Peronospora destructor]